MNRTHRRKHRSQTSGAGSLIGALLSLPVISAATWIAYSNVAIDHNVFMSEAIDAQRDVVFSKTAGQLSFYADRSGTGRPIVFVHSINAAASAYEFRPLFEHYKGRRPLYAIDLPGFGFAERTDRDYTPQLYEDAIVDFLTSRVGGPADVIALSLGCEFVSRAALARPELIHSLAMISPSGLRTSANDVQPGLEPVEQGSNDVAYRLISSPLWGRALFDLIATRASIRWFLQQSFVGAVDSALLDYDYATSHQPGAHYAPLSFISGRLFTRHVKEKVYERLLLPVLVIYDRDAYTRFDALDGLQKRRHNWRLARITPTLGLPQFERLADTVRALDIYWQGLS